MKKVLILGVNGFIGHHLSKRIIATTNWEVYGMDMASDRVTDLMSKDGGEKSRMAPVTSSAPTAWSRHG